MMYTPQGGRSRAWLGGRPHWVLAAAVLLGAPAACGGDDSKAGAGGSEGGVADAASEDAPAYAVCPDGLMPTFSSIRDNVFAHSCLEAGKCHTSEGAVDSGGLDLEMDPYTALLGADGTGAKANNPDGSLKTLKRVVPGDPDHSFLVIKLSTMSGTDPQYGSGMPFPTPGSVCPEALDAIRAWITAGALDN